jgi:hypothetical protein
MRVQYEYSIKLSEGTYFTSKAYAMDKDTQERVKVRVLNYFSGLSFFTGIAKCGFDFTIDDVTLRKVV